jgi:hypothetical protein
VIFKFGSFFFFKIEDHNLNQVPSQEKGFFFLKMRHTSNQLEFEVINIGHKS